MLKDVLIKERDALSVLIETPEEQYEPIVSLLNLCKGKIVFMGVGKSAHIGKKLAATFSSLGIPSFFVHSTEALHGDLGMLECDDIAIFISNSGETSEVLASAYPIKARGITTVAFTSGRDSSLSRLCDFSILYPKLDEADENALAPTVSSTMTLALGDAIACEISHRRGFTRDNFHEFHPGGALGHMLSQEEN